VSHVHSVVQVVGEAGWLAGWQTCRLAVGLKRGVEECGEEEGVKTGSPHTHTLDNPHITTCPPSHPP
jgi:hypothetical protein